jgi:hypothetical protein
MDTKPRRRSNTKHASRSRSIQRRHFVLSYLCERDPERRGGRGPGGGERERERERDAKTQERWRKRLTETKRIRNIISQTKVGDPSNLKLSFKNCIGTETNS